MDVSHGWTIGQHFARARWRWATLRGERLTRYQDARARAIVAYAAARAPFYRAHWAGHDLNDWRTLPPVDKTLMMDHFATFNTQGISRAAAMDVALQAEISRDFAPTLGDITVGLSSGTSGHRGLFLAAPWEQHGWVGVLLARALHRPTTRLRVAFFLRSNSNLYEQLGGNIIQFRYFDLMTPLPEAIGALNAFAPDILVGPPSLLGMLARAQAHGALRIRPQRLISVAEVLEPQDRDRLEGIFHVPVHQIYQCTEGLLAISCPRGRLHIQEDLVTMQYERLAETRPPTTPASAETHDPARCENDQRPTHPDGSGASASPPPQTGRENDEQAAIRVTPIITDLWRRTQPIIRYRLNDVLQLDPAPCPCGGGFRVIRSIEGRSDDVVYFRLPDRAYRAFFPDAIRRAILLAGEGMTDYQATQHQPG
ncbi:MAG: hypothetical protein H0X24_16425, partial [Ktedonobacterales bacterium]|nr:hypothetical protein [Ktedonobacterales bacterium]